MGEPSNSFSLDSLEVASNIVLELPDGTLVDNINQLFPAESEQPIDDINSESGEFTKYLGFALDL